MLIPWQKIVAEWKGISLKEFADKALEILKAEPLYDEVVLPADNILELEKDHKTAPRHICALPEGFEYNFSGWAGHVLGVRCVGNWDRY